MLIYTSLLLRVMSNVTQQKKGKEKERQNHLQVMGNEGITYYWQVQLGLKKKNLHTVYVQMLVKVLLHSKNPKIFN